MIVTCPTARRRLDAAFDATVAHLARHGVHAEEPGSPDGSPDFWNSRVTDPDGYRIELVQWPDEHPDGVTQSDLADPGQN
jgi:lactoylglutathione lyase